VDDEGDVEGGSAKAVGVTHSGGVASVAMAHGEDFGVACGFVDDGSAVAGEDVEQVVEVVEQEEFGVVARWVDDVTAYGSVLEHRDDVFLVGIDGLAEPLPEESAVVDGNGVAIAAELMD
jgi:hypothetical protein